MKTCSTSPSHRRGKALLCNLPEITLVQVLGRPKSDIIPDCHLSPLVELKLKIHILGALVAVIIGEATAFDCRVLAHVDTPGVVGIARQQARGTNLDRVGQDVVVVVAVIP